MDELKEKYYKFKNDTNNYGIDDIHNYVDALEKKIAELENNYRIKSLVDSMHNFSER